MAEKTDSDSPALLRKLGKMELYSSSRYALNLYRAVVVSCRYQFSSDSTAVDATTDASRDPAQESEENESSSTQAYSQGGASIVLDEARLFPALARVITQHPLLRVGIVGNDSNDARFCHLASLNLRNHVTFSAVPCQTAAEYDDAVTARQAWHHDQPWTEQVTRPPWRIEVLTPASPIATLENSHEVIFAFSHALFDGSSGKIFHESLLAALNQPPATGDAASESPAHLHELSFPSPPTLPEPQEDVVTFTCSKSYIASSLWAAKGPSWLKLRKMPPWAAQPINFSLPYKTRIKTVNVSAAALASLLSACRTRSITLQALLQALVLASLTKRLPAEAAPLFASTTPISLRPYIESHADAALKSTLRVLVTGYTHQFPARAVQKLRAASPAAADALVWDAATRAKKDLAARLASLPADDVNGLFKFVGDWFAYFNKMDGQPRSNSWEVSNVGVIANPTPAPSGSDNKGAFVRATRLLFTNAANVCGQPLSVNVASVAAGPLSLGIAWQEDVIEPELVDNLAEDLAAFADHFLRSGKFFPEE